MKRMVWAYFNRKPTPHSLSERTSCVVGSALILSIAVGVHVWADLQWTVNFDSDGAIVGLMARHILQGQIPTYFYGQQYVGSLEALLAAGFMYLFGPSVFSLRMGALLPFTLFLVLHACFVYKFWGARITLISLLVLALPGWKMLEATFRPFGGYDTLLLFGTAVLLLFTLEHLGKRGNYFRFILIGLAAGLGLWSQPMMVIYLASVLLALWLQTPEWAALHQKINATSLRLLHFSGSKVLPAVILALLGLVVIGFFSAGCSENGVPVSVQSLARWLLVAIVAGFVLLTVRKSSRRRNILSCTACFSTGLVLGSLPVWKEWLFSGVAPSTAILPSCPTDALFRMILTVTELLPAMLGTPFLSDIFRLSPLQTTLWTIILILVLTAFGTFIWLERQTLRGLFSLAPLSRNATAAALVGLLFGISLVLVLLGGNTLDVDSVRYLLIAWQATSVVLAIFFSELIARFRLLGLLVLGLWIFQVGIGNLTDIRQQWGYLSEKNLVTATGVESYPITDESVSSLEGFLKQNNVQGGYADYWVAYQLDFLSEERMTVVPYNSVDRYPPYSEKVAASPVKAFILRPGLVLPGLSQPAELAQQLTASGYVFEPIKAELEKMAFLTRQRVANWDVWLLADK